MRFFLLAFLITSTAIAESQVWEKAKAFGHLPKNGSYCHVIEGNGNIYISGTIDQNLFWIDDQMEYVKDGGRDIFILKLDSNFNKIWLKTLPNFGTEVPIEMLQDTFGQLILYGTFSDKFILGKDTLMNHGKSNPFLAKFDTSGNLIWANTYQGLSINQIKCDSKGNIYFNGSIGTSADKEKSTVNIKGISLTTFGGQDIFIGCCLPSGKMKWAKNLGSRFGDYSSLYLFNDKIYLEGITSDEFYYDQNEFYKNADEFNYGFVLKMDLIGKVEWVNSISLSGAGICGFHYLTADKEGNVMAVGVAECLEVGRRTLIKLEKYRIIDEFGPVDFIARFDKSGKAKWLKRFEFEYNFYPNKMLILNSNHFVFTEWITIYEIDSMANRIDYKKNNLGYDFKNSSESNTIKNGKMWIVGEYSLTKLTLGDFVLPKPSVDYNLFIARANFTNQSASIKHDFTQEPLNVYPNPARSILNIEVPKDNNKRFELTLTSSQGQILEKISVMSNTVLDMGAYSSGFYFLKVEDGMKNYTYKISIQN